MEFKTHNELFDYFGTHLANLTYKQVEYYCTKYFSSVPISVVDFDNSKFFFNQQQAGGANVLYRARVITNAANVGHEKIQDISFMPEDKLHLVEAYGRVNKPHEAMFYGSLDWMTACIETISKGIDFQTNDSVMLTVGTWAFRSSLSLAQLPRSLKYFRAFYEQVHFQPYLVSEESISKMNKDIYDGLRDQTDIDILSFFADEFAKFNFEGDCDYKLSNYYADRVFNRLAGCGVEPVDGIIYPSIPNSYEKLNIALRPEVIKERKLVFVDAFQVWVTDPMGKRGQTQFIPIVQNVEADENSYLQWPYLK